MARADGTGTANRERNVGRGRGGGFRAGPDGYCICPKCGERISHVIGVPCLKMTCPKCGTHMTRS